VKVVYRTVVGSKMHGLDTPDSDEDVRHVTLASLQEIISPFNNNSVKVEGNDQDTESWELSQYVKHLAQGNPTIYETIRSPLYEKTPFAKKLRAIYPLCYDPKKIQAAHIGYAEAQCKRYLRKIVEVGDVSQFDENFLRRVPKCIVAAYRVLQQGKQLLETGDFEPVIKNYDSNFHYTLMEIKLQRWDEITGFMVVSHLLAIEEWMQQLKQAFDALPEAVKNQTANIPALEQFLVEAYTQQ